VLTFEQIKELIELVADRGLQGVEIDRSGFRVTIEGRQPVAPAAPAAVAAPSIQSVPSAQAASVAPPTEVAAEAPASGGPEGAHVVSCPIVGTFYASPNPDSPPYVRIGDRVEKGAVLCIVEAMKLMNEIESDVTGVLVEIFPKNAQPVEFGEPLFAIQPD
jgi:acetyl-CoA carboxylase biotin carboxyl carrier protein